MRRKADMMNKRGHAHEFACTPDDRRLMEKTAAIEFANALRSKDAVDISDVTTSDVEPPDCFAQCNGRRVSIELTELVNSEILKKISVARRKQERAISTSRELFNEAQWTSQVLKSKIDERLNCKHNNYVRRGILIDVLVIHTAERWLVPSQVAEWLSAVEFAPRSSFKTAYLLMSYFPGYADHWPVFTLYGTL
jgi:hypothetical protein